jgi:hypothetical protein
MHSKVDFIAVDNSYANKLMLHMLTAFTGYERDNTWTKKALAAAKWRGVRLAAFVDVLARQSREAAEQFAE